MKNVTMSMCLGKTYSIFATKTDEITLFFIPSELMVKLSMQELVTKDK